MPRVIALFAKRGLTPRRVEAARVGEELTIDLQADGLSGEAAEHIAACLRQIVGVERVLTAVKMLLAEARLA
jgi:hypothetical protein